jgi:hypothetical protein
MGLISALGTGPVGVDTCMFIDLIEGGPRRKAPVLEFFRAVDAGRLRVVQLASVA